MLTIDRTAEALIGKEKYCIEYIMAIHAGRFDGFQ